jgi:hypothetical protein
MPRGSNAIDMTGQRFGRLTVLRKSETRSPDGALWHCECECGSVKLVPRRRLVSGNTKSCGCLKTETSSGVRFNRRGDDLTGRRFGSWTVLRPEAGKGYLLLCDCGKEGFSSPGPLVKGSTLRCATCSVPVRAENVAKALVLRRMDLLGAGVFGPDISGAVYGRVTVESRGSGEKWNVVCECGTRKQLSGLDLREGRITRCGRACGIDDISGLKIGEWSILGRDPDAKMKYLCSCSCGDIYSIFRSALQQGRSRMCKPCAAVRLSAVGQLKRIEAEMFGDA